MQFLPVIHCLNRDQALKNLNICSYANVDGCFFINHGKMKDSDFTSLLEEVKTIRGNDTWFKLGVNFLNFSNIHAFLDANSLGYDYLWVDNAYTDNLDDNQAWSIKKYQIVEGPTSPKLFGGIHFKYQQKSPFAIEESLRRCHDLVDVPTLSGCQTGRAADLEFIKKAAYSTDKCLAIASGITIENVRNFIPYIDYFLVASSITDDREILIKEKVEAMNDIICGG